MKQEECEHPFWQEESDGHCKTWWRCTECQTTRWIAPWILKEKTNEQRNCPRKA